jgi:spore maturation protein CgeB
MLRAFRPVLVLFVKCDDIRPAVYERVRAATGACLAAFHPDDPFEARGWLRRGPAAPGNALGQMRSVDSFFVWSDRLAQQAARAGARAHVLSFAADPLLHHPVALSDSDLERFGADACFVGNWDRERERWLSSVDGCRLAIWGDSYWGSACNNRRLRAAWRGRPLVGDDMAKAVLASAINLNVLRIQNKNACNMRTYEIPACGGFLLHERSDGLHRILTPGVECDDFGTPDELLAKVRHWLGDAKRRREIAERGHAKIQRHTYQARAREILRVVDLAPDHAPSRAEMVIESTPSVPARRAPRPQA